MSSTNINIRKVHNDRFDSKKAALIGLNPDLKVSLIPSELALDLRNLSREYYDLMDYRSAYINKLHGELRMVFPQYLKIFSKVTTNTSLTLLENYASPDAFLSAKKQEIVDTIRSTARFGLTYANNNYNAIIQAAKDSKPLVILSTATSSAFRFTYGLFASTMKKSLLFWKICMSW